jgi:hypothetical protein
VPASPPSTPCRKLPGKRQTCRTGEHRCRAAASQTHQGCSLPYRPIVPSSHRPAVPWSHASLSPMAQRAAARLPCVRPNAPRAARPVARCAWHLRGGRCSVCKHSAHAHATCIMHMQRHEQCAAHLCEHEGRPA